MYLVCLRGLVEHPGVDGRRHQVVGRGDGVNVPRKMEVKLMGEGDRIKPTMLHFDFKLLGLGRYAHLPIRYHQDTLVSIRYELRFFKSCNSTSIAILQVSRFYKYRDL